MNIVLFAVVDVTDADWPESAPCSVGQTDARTQPPWLRTARVSHRSANLEPDPGLANHLLWLVNARML